MPTNYEKLIERVNELDDLNKAAALLSWDREVNMPRAGAPARIAQMTTMSSLIHRMSTADEMGELIENAAAELDGAPYESNQAALIRLLRRTQALPGLSAPRIWAVAALLAVALVTWFLGRTDSTLCSPESLLQWHALWHTLSALTFGVWGLVLFARSPAESSRQAASDQTEVLQ